MTLDHPVWVVTENALEELAEEFGKWLPFVQEKSDVRLDRGAWKESGLLRAGDRLRTWNGEILRVESLSRRPLSDDVYNLEVDGTHTYFVGASGMLVHNKI